MLKIAFPGLWISKFSGGGGMPPHPPGCSSLRRSYFIPPLNKYSCQYEHPSKTLSYAPDLAASDGNNDIHGIMQIVTK